MSLKKLGDPVKVVKPHFFVIPCRKPFHLQFEAVDHPLVLRLHVLDVQDLFQLLKPGVEIEK